MKPKFDKKRDYNELDVLDEIVRARLFQDYDNLDDSDEGLKEAYRLVLEYNTVYTDKRLKKLVNNF